MTDLAVLMSVYENDRLDFLKESVYSILNQTFADFHYYLIIDGPVSHDIEEFVSSLDDERLRLFRLEKNGGLAAALNYLLKIVIKNPDYELIARMDADDISLPDRFEKQRNYLLENRGITILGCWYEEINEEGEHLSFRKLPTDHESLKRRYFTRTPFAHPSVIFRRDLIEVAGFYPTDTILMEDNVLWGRALNCEMRFANIPDYLFKFRINRSFYRRRSGFDYGRKYIRTRFVSFRTLHASFYSYLFLFGFGILKMSPTYIIKIYYNYIRKAVTIL
jgi:glycosyltransferase involved in cell wall biosynthesis